MKTKLLITVTLLLAGSLFFSASAQDNIDALIEKCKKLEGVEVVVSKYRSKKNPETKETTEINILNNKDIVAEFIAAFKKDSEMAESSSETETNGVISNIYCKFGKDNIYTYSTFGKSMITVSAYREGVMLLVNIRTN